MLTRKLPLGLSGFNWESKQSEHMRVGAPKCSWGVGGGGGGGGGVLFVPHLEGLSGQSSLKEILRP